MKAVIYCRVSTVEQAQKGYSLESQESDCKQFALREGLVVERVFIERGESAKTQDRTELQKLIRYSIENKREIKAVIVWKLDRLTRQLSDQTDLSRQFGSLGVKLLSVTESNEDNSVGRLMRNIVGSFAQYENDVKSERTKKGMLEAIKQGRFAWRAPVGYINSRDEANKSKLVLSPESVFITEAFRLAATGLHKQSEIVYMLRRQGFKKASKGLINRILRNPVYASLIKTAWMDELLEAAHEPLISKTVFFKVQAILDGKKPVIAVKVRSNPDFPLRNFVKCPNCGRKLTGSWSRGRKKKYAYYHCVTKHCPLMNLKKLELETVFYENLRRLQFNKGMAKLFEAIILDVWHKKHDEEAKDVQRLEKELKALQSKKDRIDELMIRSVMDDETYKKKSAETKSELLAKNVELNERRIDLGDEEACLEYCKHLLSNLADLWLTQVPQLPHK